MMSEATISRKRTAWTKEEVEYLRANWERSDAELSGILNRPIGSIGTKRRALGLVGKPNERGKKWTRQQLDYLDEVWGEKTIPEIAKKLGKSIHAVKIKAIRTGHLGQKWTGEMMSARKVAELLGVDVHAVCDYWIPKCGLKAKRKRLGESKKTTTIIMFEDLLEWLREHQELWDSRRIELWGLGMEYDWLRDKRKADRLLPLRKAQKWTSQEDGELIRLWKRGDKTHAEIAEILHRSSNAVERRLSRLDVWGTGRHIPEKERKEKKAQSKDAFERRVLMLRLRNALLVHRNAMEYGEFWQKDMCQHWDKAKGCTAGERSCDECVSFLRIVPQHCVRCGATFLERKEALRCERCREQRKKSAYRKLVAMRGGGGR